MEGHSFVLGVTITNLGSGSANGVGRVIDSFWHNGQLWPIVNNFEFDQIDIFAL